MPGLDSDNRVFDIPPAAQESAWSLDLGSFLPPGFLGRSATDKQRTHGSQLAHVKCPVQLAREVRIKPFENVTLAEASPNCLVAPLSRSLRIESIYTAA